MAIVHARPARRNRQLGAAVNGVAGLILLFSVVLNERAVRAEGVEVPNYGSYAAGLAALFGFVAAWLALRSASDVRAGGIGAPVTVTVFMVAIAMLGAFLAAIGPVLYNVISGACLAGGSKTMFGADAPGPCGYTIPISHFPLFYPSAYAAAAAAALGIVSAVLLMRGGSVRGSRSNLAG